jgi:hypothetical protein
MSRNFSENLNDLHLMQIYSDCAKAAYHRIARHLGNHLSREPLPRRSCISATEYSPFRVNASPEIAP